MEKNRQKIAPDEDELSSRELDTLHLLALGLTNQEIAAKLNLNLAQFEKDRKDPLLLEQIRHDYNEAIRIGLRSVPTVFVNGRKLKDRSLNGFQALIDKELESLKQKK